LFYNLESEALEVLSSDIHGFLKFLEFYYQIDYFVSMDKEDEFNGAILKLDNLQVLLLKGWQDIFFGSYLNYFLTRKHK
jgi:hypothetical protein